MSIIGKIIEIAQKIMLNFMSKMASPLLMDHWVILVNKCDLVAMLASSYVC